MPILQEHLFIADLVSIVKDYAWELPNILVTYILPDGSMSTNTRWKSNYPLLCRESCQSIANIATTTTHGIQEETKTPPEIFCSRFVCNDLYPHVGSFPIRELIVSRNPRLSCCFLSSTSSSSSSSVFISSILSIFAPKKHFKFFYSTFDEEYWKSCCRVDPHFPRDLCDTSEDGDESETCAVQVQMVLPVVFFHNAPVHVVCATIRKDI